MKIICLFTFFIFLISCSSSTDSGDEVKNLIKNPDFEESTDGIRPDIWKEYVWYCPPCGGFVNNIFIDSANVQSGNYSGRMEFYPYLLPAGL